MIMNIFRRLRWQLTLSYTVVTVCALLVVTIILSAVFLPRIFIPNNYFSPEALIEGMIKNDTKIWSPILSQTPVDTKLIKGLLSNPSGQITNFDLLRIGNIQFSVRTLAIIRGLVIGADKTLYGKFDEFFYRESLVGQPFNVSAVSGLEVPFNSALAGQTDPKLLYAEIEKDNLLILAIPVFSDRIGDEGKVVGVIVMFVESFPTRKDVPWNIFLIAGRFLILFLFGAGVIGAVFGAITANGLARRFKRMSYAADHWSEGDFSSFINDSTGDEISKFGQRLDEMAKQLQSLLRKRQEMAISEERNRLARDLHDSAKQQALAASFELGTALALFEPDPQNAKKHLIEADSLVDSVRQELTNLVQELLPLSMEGQGLSEILRDYAIDWSHRNGIELAIKIDAEIDGLLSLESKETLFRVAQEALANITRHSSAKHADLLIENDSDGVMMVIKDDGCGFDTNVQHTGVGLRSMRERIREIGGVFTIESARGQGANIIINLPVASTEG